MRELVKTIVRRTPLRFLHDAWIMRARGRSQSDETEIIARLVASHAVPGSFCEFGFHPHEFNCSGLLERFEGLLIDGDDYTVQLARRTLRGRLTIRREWLTLESLRLVGEHFSDRELGVLSVDVDGNDYWFLRALLPLRPALVVVEYNASFMHEPVTVTYDPAFDRHAKDPSGWYHGASLAALATLCDCSGYSLVAVASAGGNAFFLRNDLLQPTDVRLDPAAAWRESTLRNQWSKTTAAMQWGAIRGRPLVRIDDGNALTVGTG